MDLTYKNLEKNYYKTLHNIALSLGVKNKSKLKTELPYLLENAALSRLKPKSRWIISAISGSGKTTISKLFILEGFSKLPNVTTRPRRPEEKRGDCIFVSNAKFLSWKKDNLLFHPHKRNGVWQGILKKDMDKLVNKNYLVYLDKSVASSLELKKGLPKKVNFTFVYVLAPTFKELNNRIRKRESFRKKNEKNLSKKEIFKRFEEEIKDMKKSTKLPYTYIVNDSLVRVKKLLKKSIRDSRNK